MEKLPSWEKFIIPVLRVLKDGTVLTRRELAPLVAKDFGLDETQMKQVLSGGQLAYVNRTGWAISFLTNIGATERPARGRYAITPAGLQVLAQFPSGATEKELRALGVDPGSLLRPYVATTNRESSTVRPIEEQESLTPIEQVEQGIARIHEEVATELLMRLQEKDPGFFESAVVKLLLAMGYGGTSGSGTVTQLSNDGGIDGVIDQDILGLNKVYIQAKRYADTNVVQRPDVQGFVGALSGKADSGVFITTSRFSDGARKYADGVPTRIILIDGARLTDLMIRFGVGVQTQQVYTAVEIDEDFFE